MVVSQRLHLYITLYYLQPLLPIKIISLPWASSDLTKIHNFGTTFFKEAKDTIGEGTDGIYEYNSLNVNNYHFSELFVNYFIIL